MLSIDQLPSPWRSLLTTHFSQDSFLSILNGVNVAYQQTTVFPPSEQVFATFAALMPYDVRVVILGQDPYHGQSQAHGFSFSVPNGMALPPWLRNIFKEIAMEYNTLPNQETDLSRWVDQGVFLLNSYLTVEEGKAGSHRNLGWQQFTDAVIRYLSEVNENLVFLLWGKPAAEKKSLITGEHLILEAPHPSPLSAHRGFFGCDHFIKANEYLEAHGKSPIVWSDF